MTFDIAQSLTTGLVTTVVTASNDFWTFLGLVLFIWFSRVLLLKSLVTLGRSPVAEPTRITKKPSITDKQIERESVWPLGYFLDAISMIIVRSCGIFENMEFVEGTLTALAWELLFHATIVEFIYYLFHRGLHVQWLYKRWHQYHHKSINTEPTTAVSFEVGERLAYTVLFAIAPVLTGLIQKQTYAGFLIYLLWFDFMNEGGHINFEVLPAWYFRSPLRYVFYSPTFHAVHHTKFKKNYSLFMPWTDILFGTAVYTYDEQLAQTKLFQNQHVDEETGVRLAVETQDGQEV
jgi:aldehyde decarbonylase